jgi:hypothetical protein
MDTPKPIFDFLASRNARLSCPFCGHELWHGWDERLTLTSASRHDTVDRQTEVFPLTCANCGFVPSSRRTSSTTPGRARAIRRIPERERRRRCPAGRQVARAVTSVA